METIRDRAIEAAWLLGFKPASDDGQYPWPVRLHKEEMTICVRTEKGRLIFWAVFPQGYQPGPFQITVSGERDAVAISREIDSRLVRIYRPTLKRVLGEKAAYDAEELSRREKLKALAGIVDGTQHDPGGPVYFHEPLYGELYVTGDSVRMKLDSVPYGVACDLLDLLRRKINQASPDGSPESAGGSQEGKEVEGTPI